MKFFKAIFLILSCIVSAVIYSQHHEETVYTLEQKIDQWNATDQDINQSLYELIQVHMQNQEYMKALVHCNTLINRTMGDLSYSKYLYFYYAYNFKSECFFHLGRYDEAIECNDYVRIFIESAKDTASAVVNRIRSANYYWAKGDYTIALEEFHKVLNFSVENNIPVEKSIYTGLSVAYEALGKVDTSIYYNKVAIALGKKNPTTIDSLTLITDYSNLSATYGNIKEHQKAIQYLDSACAYANYDTALFPFPMFINYFRNYHFLGESDISRRFLDLYIAYEEDFYLNKMNLEIDALETMHYKEKLLLEDKFILEQKNFNNQRKIANIVILVLIVCILGLIYFYYISRRKRKLQQQKTLFEQKLLRSQMNPHFIFNTLSVIQSHVDLQQTQKASTYLSSFAQLMRITLENSNENLVTIESEIEGIEKYLSLQLMRFEDQFEYKIDRSRVKSMGLLIPPMLIQPFVENAVLHGVNKLNRKGKITIQVIEKGNTIVCTIEDNGVGLQLEKKSKKSMSTEIVRRRLQMLSHELKISATVSVINKTDNGKTGVLVTLRIPFTF